MKLIRVSDNAVLLEHLEVAKGFFKKAKGLLGRASIDENTGLLFEGCNSVHTFGMRFDIDVLFLDRHRKVTKVYFQLQPQRLAFDMRARYVIELMGGVLAGKGIVMGDELAWRED